MPMPKPNKDSGGKQRYEVLFEEVSSKMDLVLDTLKEMKALPERMECMEFRLSRVEEELKLVKQAVFETASQLKLHQKEHAA